MKRIYDKGKKCTLLIIIDLFVCMGVGVGVGVGDLQVRDSVFCLVRCESVYIA